MQCEYLVDIGNSALKWANALSPQKTGVIRYDGDMVHLAEQVRDFCLAERPELIYACTVAKSEIASTLERVCDTARVEWLGSQAAFEGEFRLRNRYDDYSKLGPDRWYAALGAVKKHPGMSLLILQMGTCLTADAVKATGNARYEYLGGRIAPGPAMMYRSLVAGTARLRDPAGEWKAFPLNTSDAMMTGITDCVRGFVAGGLEAFGGDESPRLIITGGAARYFEKEFMRFFPNFTIEDNLVITGLSLRVASEARGEKER